MAESFIEETNSQPSHLLSSRHRYADDVSESNDLEDFKEEI